LERSGGPWRRRAGSRRGSLDSRRAAARLSGGGAGALEMTGRPRCCGSSGQREAGQFGATGGGVPLLQAELWPPPGAKAVGDVAHGTGGRQGPRSMTHSGRPSCGSLTLLWTTTTVMLERVWSAGLLTLRRPWQQLGEGARVSAAAVARTSDVMWGFHWLLWKHDTVGAVSI
jgi:hypothetical protein